MFVLSGALQFLQSRLALFAIQISPQARYHKPMYRLLVCLSLFLSACGQVNQGSSSAAWNGMKYSEYAAVEPAGFIRMGK